MQIAIEFTPALSVNDTKHDVADIGPFRAVIVVEDRDQDAAEFESQIIRETGPALQRIVNDILAAGIAARAVEAGLRATLDATDDSDRREEIQAAVDAAHDAIAPADIPFGVQSDEQRRADQNLALPGDLEPGSKVVLPVTAGAGEPGHPAAEPIVTEPGSHTVDVTENPPITQGQTLGTYSDSTETQDSGVTVDENTPDPALGSVAPPSEGDGQPQTGEPPDAGDLLEQ